MSKLMFIIQGIRIFLILNIAYLMMIQDFANAIVLFSAVVLTFVPEIMKKFMKLTIPVSLHFTGVLFVLASQWLGTYLRAYDMISWWDVMLHGFSALLVAMIGLLIMIYADKELVLFKHKKHGLVSLYVFLATATSAVLWEIFEYVGDTYFGTNAQLGSLSDTMEDMVICVIVGGFFALYLYYTLKRNKKNRLSKELDKLIKANERRGQA